MRGEDAFAVLGLRPGAGRAEIDQAYRRLIKRYHPDFADGDAARAADINRAYAMLRARGSEWSERPLPPAAVIHPQAYARQRTGRRRGALLGVTAILAAVGIAVGASMKTDNGRSWADLTTPGITDDRAPRALAPRADLDEPLAARLIELSIEDAVRLHAAGDAQLASEFSRNCLRRMSASPSLPLFDSCAAYDEAITILTAYDSTFESGAFNPSAVTARQVSAARMLAADYFEAESRLQRIRSRVQIMMLSGIPEPSRQRIQAAEPVEPPARIVAAPVVAPSIEPRAQPRIELQRGIAPQPRQRTVTAAARAPARPRAQPARFQRPARPPARSAPPQAPATRPETETREVPTWQKPIKPAWQRPMPPPSQ